MVVGRTFDSSLDTHQTVFRGPLEVGALLLAKPRRVILALAVGFHPADILAPSKAPFPEHCPA